MTLAKRGSWIGLLGAMLFLVACGSAAGEGTSGPASEAVALPDSVSCQVFYRSAPDRPLGGSTLTLATDGDQGVLDFDDMRFEATFLSDVGEGKSLSTVVTDANSGAELGRSLYQVDPQQGLNNHFIGGHGFTGLIYVFQPESGSEIQYFCAAGS